MAEAVAPKAAPQVKSKLGPGARRFLIEMDGQVKEIKIEALDSPQVPILEVKPIENAVQVEEATMTNGSVTSPMQGTILKVNVKVGDSVKKGDVIAVLEAMKMENDIVAHSSGTVKAVYAQKGKNVEANAVLAIIE